MHDAREIRIAFATPNRHENPSTRLANSINSVSKKLADNRQDVQGTMSLKDEADVNTKACWSTACC